jgi:hypothetical protein
MTKPKYDVTSGSTVVVTATPIGRGPKSLAYDVSTPIGFRDWGQF